MNRTQLAEICDIVMGQSPPSSTYNTAGDGLPFFQGKADFGANTPHVRTYCSAPNKVALPGDILLSVRAPVGPTNRARVKSAIGRGLAAIRAKATFSQEYLYRFLQYAEPALANKGVGSTFEAVSREDIDELSLNLVPLERQLKVARQLDMADRLRHMRRHMLEMSERLLVAVFLEMFGDPTKNVRDWPLLGLEEMATVERGKFTPRPRNDPSYYGGRFPFIQTGDITNSGGRLRWWRQTLNEKGVQVSRRFPVGTIVIAIVGATIGMTAILEVDVYCPDSVVGIQIGSGTATKEYIEFVLRFWRPIFLARAPETARANINLDTLRPLRIPVPPLPLQQKFSTFIERLECLRVVQREAFRQAEHLFQTLLHEAFGETA